MELTSRVVVMSAKPMPMALPCVSGVRSRTKMRRIIGLA